MNRQQKWEFNMVSRRCAYWMSGVGAILLLLSPSRAVRGAETTTNGIHMKLVLVPAGEFMMGSEESRTDTINSFPYCDPKWLDDELFRHRVRITKPFYMGQYTVTLGEFLVFYHDAHYQLEMERDGKPHWGYDSSGKKQIESPDFRPWAPGWNIGMDHPVVYVSWNDAMAFCDWLSKREEKTYRLPTEAEWEYACRAGTNTRFYFGDDPEDLVYYANGPDADCAAIIGSTALLFPSFDKYGNKTGKQLPFPYLKRRDGYVWTAPVGKFRPNAFGLYDMHGNVCQWCSDWYDAHYYENTPVDDPKGPPAGSSRVARGGAFSTQPVALRCASRDAFDKSRRGFLCGFRVVCEP
jgi:formylglycine-generating enzyme